MTRDYAAEALADNRRAAMRAIHISVKPSRRAFRLGSASDPILALASEPYQFGISEFISTDPRIKRRRS